MGETVIPVVNKGFGAFNDFFTLLRDNSKIGMETFEKGSRLETSLVPDLAKQITQLKKAGKTSEEILKTLAGTAGREPEGGRSDRGGVPVHRRPGVAGPDQEGGRRPQQGRRGGDQQGSEEEGLDRRRTCRGRCCGWRCGSRVSMPGWPVSSTGSRTWGCGNSSPG